MFLNPWYSGQPGSGVQPVVGSPAQPENGHPASPPSPDDGPPPTHSSDPGQDLVVEQANLTDEQLRQVTTVQQSLRPGWTVHLTTEGRFYYCNHYNQTSGWLPPSDSWNSSDRLPYGWESAVDLQGKTYFVNHLNKTTTAEDPRKWECIEHDSNPEPRTVVLTRDAEHGFGFVAGSEKPVIVRFVRSGGPSVNRLMPGDLIMKINGEDVRQAPRDHVIQLIRDCAQQVTLEVCQPPLDNTSTRKSAILSAAKKSRLKSQPSRVRFAESVDIDGASDHSRPTSMDSVLPLMPNVLKVFLENGQTKSFKYDTTTRVQDVINSLQAKLGLASTLNFSLVVEHVKSVRRNKFTILDPAEHLCRIASRPGVHNLRCLFRVTFFPVDAYDLLCQDPQAFEYLYLQCCNDVIHERFSPELKNDVALRLASLHMYQHALAANGPGSKVTIKMVEKEYGLERFVPMSLADSMKKKEMQKLLGHFLKLNSNLLGPGQKQLTALQAQLHYLKIISELPSYGAKCFSTNISDSNLESVVLISPKFGISQINSLRNGVPINLCDMEEVTSITVTREDHVSQKIHIQLKDTDKDSIMLTLETRDSNEFILVLAGYYRLVCLRELEVERDEVSDDTLIPYCSRHQVPCQGWNYPHNNDSDCLHFVNFGAHPPYQSPPPGLQFLDSDDSSLWSSSTETTNVDERASLIDFQQTKPETTNQRKTRFEIVPCKSNGNDEDDDDEDEDEINDVRISATLMSASVDDPKPNFSLCCGDAGSVSTLPLLPKKTQSILHPDSLEGNDFSFGLHSPDSFPTELTSSTSVLSSSNLLSKKNEKKILTDADLIDLTTLPPPLTPDDEKFLLSSIVPGPIELVETPPTPFADRILGQDLSKSPLLSDIESFIAKVTVPPPPEDFHHLDGAPARKDRKNSTHDFSGFIIPPPPPPRVNLSPSTHHNNQQAVRFGQATSKLKADFDPNFELSAPRAPKNGDSSKLSDDVKSTPTSSYSTLQKVSFTDRELQEIRVAKETFFKEPKEKISPRIASIQKMLAGSTSQDSPMPDVAKKTSPPPPPPRSSAPVLSSPRHALSSTSRHTITTLAGSPHHTATPKSGSLSRAPAPPPLHQDFAKPLLPLPGKSDADDPPSLPPRVSNSAKRDAPPTPPESPGDEHAKPLLPSKTHRSLPKIPDPGTKPVNPLSKPVNPVKPEKPQLPKKGFSSTSLDAAKTDVLSKKHSLDSSNPHIRASPADLQLSPLKPRAVSGSPLRINQTPGRPIQDLNHTFIQNSHNKKSSLARASPVTVATTRHTNGIKASEVELESGVDSDNENCDFGRQDQAELSRSLLFEQAEEVVVRVIASIDRSQQICSSPIERQLTPETNEIYQKAKEQLTNDSRQFVTASKLFVKSATENERQLLECLGHCVTLIDRIGTVTNDVALYTVTPQQTLALLVKVRDVAETYLITVKAAGQAAGKELNDPSMDVLMKRATTLASVLTNLMRTLRVFV